MKIRRFQYIACACVLLVIFVAGFFFGGVYASGRAVQADNKASIVYFSGIHDALARQDYARAATITNAAVDSHVGVLRDWANTPLLLRGYYASPWTQGQQSVATSGSLLSVRVAYAAQPEQLQAATRGFLDARH